MDFSDYEFLPGTVINVEDPEKRGRIKACVPTWFDTSVMQEEALPWIVPSSMGGYQRFSKLELGSKVWVIHKKKSNKEYWYLPMFELDDKTSEIVSSDYDSPEVLLSRSTGDSGVYIYYNTTDGVMIKNGDLEVHLTNNKEIEITDGTAFFKISGSKINIGKDEGQQTLMGEDVKDLLVNLAGELKAIGVKMQGNQYVGYLSGDFVESGNNLQKATNTILSDTVKISR